MNESCIVVYYFDKGTVHALKVCNGLLSVVYPICFELIKKFEFLFQVWEKSNIRYFFYFRVKVLILFREFIFLPFDLLTKFLRNSKNTELSSATQ